MVYHMPAASPVVVNMWDSLYLFALKEIASLFLAACCCCQGRHRTSLTHHTTSYHITISRLWEFDEASIVACDELTQQFLRCVSSKSMWQEGAQNVNFEHLDLAQKDIYRGRAWTQNSFNPHRSSTCCDITKNLRGTEAFVSQG